MVVVDEEEEVGSGGTRRPSSSCPLLRLRFSRLCCCWSHTAAKIELSCEEDDLTLLLPLLLLSIESILRVFDRSLDGTVCPVDDWALLESPLLDRDLFILRSMDEYDDDADECCSCSC